MNFEAIKQSINESSHVAIIGHKSGDTDCFGSAFGLSMGLSFLGKDTSVISPEPLPSDLEFLYFYYDNVILEKIDKRTDLLIIVDSSDLVRVSASEMASSYIKSGGKTILLDHHTKGDLSTLISDSYVDTSACSTSEIVFRLLSELQVHFDKNISTCLLAGIVGDTSSFQNQNTTQSCLDVASKLMKTGGRLQTIISHTFGGKEVNALKLWGLAMERLYVNEKYGIVSTYITHDDIVEFGLSNEAVMGIVNYLNSIKGARMVALITEEEAGKMKVSFRTRDNDVDVAALARQLGGGGHVKAAGFSFSGSMTVSDGTAQVV